jgi:hypothetical protein
VASIFDVFGRLLLDDTKFQSDAEKAGQRAGDKVGATMSTRMAAGLKAGLVGLGAAGGLLFTAASRGGAELKAAVVDFQAATGATAEEAEAAQGSIKRLYQSNLNGFEELGGVLASVRQNLGLTGDAGEVAAQRILDYAKVTGQDAVGATEAFDDLLDSLGLSYEEGSGLLDQLVRSHQLYGGSVEENQAALARLAPALNAANLSVDDGVGLLNLFAASGIDAAAAPQALTKALSKVESPEELQTLIDQISATEDPFARAALASDLFGVKAGAKLANALDGADFSTFTVGVDEAAGAIETASDVIDNAPLEKLKLALKGVGGQMAEVGTKFGPLILGFSQLGGPRLIGSITAGLGGLAGKLLPALVPALTGLVPALAGTLASVGAAMGGALAAAVPIGIAALPVILLAALVAAIAFLVMNPEIVAEIARVVGSILDSIATFLQELPAIFLAAFDKAMEVAGQVLAALPGIVWDVIMALPGILAQVPGMLLTVVGKLLELWSGAWGAILRIAQGLITRVVGFVLGIPGRVAPMVGQLVGHFIALVPKVVNLVTSLVGRVVGFFMSIPGKIAALGGRIVGSIINGMASLPGKLADVIRRAFANLRIDIGPFHISGSGITIDMPNIQLPQFAGGGRPVPGQVALIGEKGPELWVPDQAGTILPAGAFTSMALEPATSSGDTYQLTTYGLPLRAQTPVEVVHQLRRAARLGGITPPRKRPTWSGT